MLGPVAEIGLFKPPRDPEAGQFDEIVRLAQSRRWRQSRCRAGRGAGHHRAERRRQVDPVQPDHRRCCGPTRGAICVRRPRHHAGAAARALRRRHRPLVPDSAAVREPDRVRESARRRRPRPPAARGARSSRPAAKSWSAPASSPSPTAAPARLTCSTASGWSSRARSPARRGFCCSTRSPAA